MAFLGPSLDMGTADSVCPGALYLPPARCGDLIQLKQLRPKVVVLIDGEFEHTAAVWHKEILDLLQCGISVLGSSSMGALRAAELHTFGMIGVGEVFRRYRDGEILDDDEVALQYVCAPWGYIPLSEPMVNCRVTIERAVAAGAISAAEARRLLATAKQTFFQGRTWERILLPGFDTRVQRAVKEYYTDQKREDAIAALALAQSIRAHRPRMRPVRVQPSVFLRKLRGEAVCRVPSPAQAPRGLDLSFAVSSGGDCVFLYERLAVMLANASCLAPAPRSEDAAAKSPGRRVLAFTNSARLRAATSPARLHRFNTYAQLLFENAPWKSMLNDARHVRALGLLVLFWSVIDWVAERRGFMAEGERLARLADDFRKSRNLEKASDTRRWLRRHGMSQDAFVEFLRAQDRVMFLCDSFNMQLLGIGEHMDDSVHWLQEAVALACESAA
ncbi:MAG: TfuA-like protein [Reyranellaceae bacterium]